MKKILVIMSLLALSFTTGFTCSKNSPDDAKPTDLETTSEMTNSTSETPSEGDSSQELMAQPAEEAHQQGSTMESSGDSSMESSGDSGQQTPGQPAEEQAPSEE